MKRLQQRKIVITGEGYYAPPTLLMEEGTERRVDDEANPNNAPCEIHATLHESESKVKIVYIFNLVTVKLEPVLN